MTEGDQPLLAVDGLRVDVVAARERRTLLHDVSLRVGRGQMCGLVGETGSGKSMTARAVTRLLPHAARVVGGTVLIEGTDVLGLPGSRMRALLGRRVSTVFQNPRTALHPMLTVHRQMANVLASHEPRPGRSATAQILDGLTRVGIPDPDRVAAAYPHELSGGLAQRVVIGTALLCRPALLIADEPTTGLDVTVQREILDLLADLQQRLGLGVLLITHDLGVVAGYCDTTTVMRDGRVIESGTTTQVLGRPEHAYTRRLVAASSLVEAEP